MKKQKLFWIRENRSISWMTFLMSLISCYFIYSFRNDLGNLWQTIYMNDISVGKLDETFTNAFAYYLSTTSSFYHVMLFLIAILTFLMFHNMSSQKTKEWIGSLPLKNSSMYWYKLRQGIIAYTIPIILFGGGCIFLMVNNRGWMANRYLLTGQWKYLLNQESIQKYLIVAGMIWLWATACYMVFFFAQSICRNAVIGLLLGLGMINVSGNFGWLMMLINMEDLPGKVSAQLATYGFRFYRCFTGICTTEELLNDGTYMGAIFEDFSGMITYHAYWYEFVVIAVTVLVMLLLSYHYFKKMHQPGTQGLFISGLMRAFVLWGFSFCVTADVWYLVVALMSLDTTYELVVYLAAVPISIVVAVILHLLCKRRGC